MVSGNDEIVDDNNNNSIFVDDVGVTHGPITTSYDPETGSYASSTWMTRNGAASSSENVDPANDDDMAMISNLLFRAVASSDYTALVTLYANHARISILQFLQMKRRWSGHSHHHNDSDSHEYGAGRSRRIRQYRKDIVPL